MQHLSFAVSIALLAACHGTQGPRAPAPSAESQRSAKPAPDTPPTRGPQDPPPDVAAPPAGAQTTKLGVHYLVLHEESTAPDSPGETDIVSVHYQGWTTDGKLFDSSIVRKTPASFPLARVIPGFRDGIMHMRVGQRMRFWIPEELAYKGRENAPEGMLVFEVELLGIEASIEEPEFPLPPDDVRGPPDGATTTASGLAYRVLTPGTGTEMANPHDRVVVHYTGWRTDGERAFDSSHVRGKPAEFALSSIIAGWKEALPLMKVGEKTRFWVPEELAYKDRPEAPQGMLVFDIELLEIIRQPAPPPVPKDVAKPPRRAKRTKSGLRYLRLVRGKGTQKPGPSSHVTVHYTGWTTDGVMFDSSIPRAKSATFPLDAVIPGFTEGLQLMRVGDAMRFWIPEELTYKGKPGAPQGMLVFEIELLEIADEQSDLTP